VIPGGEVIRGLRCLRCNGRSPAASVAYTCPSCGGNQVVEYDLDLVRNGWPRDELLGDEDFSMWRYAALLPVTSRLDGPPVGLTPLIAAPALARELGLGRVLVKDEGRNPSGSLKDRASAVALVRAREADCGVVTTASAGNAGAATALLAATAGVRVAVFVPRSVPRAKLARLLVCGAEVWAVDGTDDDAFELSLAATHKLGWYNGNTGFNPFTREGQKTVAFEICEQLGMRAPDVVVVPVGDGNIISGVWKGFVELAELDFVESRPRLIAVQAEGSDAVVQALEGDGVIRAARGASVADSISVRLPHDGEAAVRAVRESGGVAIRVSDEEILAAIPAFARAVGVIAEPAAAAAYAGLRRAAREGRLAEAGIVIVLATGNGLKDIPVVLRPAAEPRIIPADPTALEQIVVA
jgi:threonine synthase